MKLRVKSPNGRTGQIEIDEDLIWMEPFVLYSRRYGIPIWRLKKIKGYWVQKNKTEAQKAQIAVPNRSRKYVITVLKRHQMLIARKGRIRVDGYAEVQVNEGYLFEETLDSLAHELAHTIEWNHTADRFILEKRILLGFARLAKRLGYEGYDRMERTDK